ncbi:hypothetical protein L1049_011845 [Liquidambar formosana]|uniref:Uncharacterized protein n=1 Tax=Liquidambar formosana TaxID=63359 RepID=A0AAP0RS39_LIQFO
MLLGAIPISTAAFLARGLYIFWLADHHGLHDLRLSTCKWKEIQVLNSHHHAMIHYSNAAMQVAVAIRKLTWDL